MAGRANSDWRLYRRLLGYALPYWHFFLLSIAGYLLYSLVNVLLADLMQYLLDALGNERQHTRGFIGRAVDVLFADSGWSAVELARVVVPVVILLLTFTRAMGFFAGTYFMSHVARNVVHELRCQLFDKMLLLPGAYFDQRASGELVSRLTFNVEQVAGAVTKALKIIVRETLVVLALLSYMLYLNWRLCLLFIIVAPFIALVVRYVGRRFRRYSRRIQAAMGDVTQVGSESVDAWREVRVYGGQPRQRAQFRQASDRNREQSLKLALADALSTPVIQTLLALALASLVWFALRPDVLAGFTPGSLVAFLTAAGQLGKPIRQLSGVQSVLQRGLAAAEDIFRQLDLAAEADTGDYRVARARGEIDVQTVTFTYPEANRPAIENISLHVPAGSTLALVGRSGSGKSTLVQLLARFYDPGAGNIRLDGVPLADYALDNLRQQFAIVSQHVPLLRDTVYNNVAFGSLAQRSRDEVLAAIEAAHAREFIEALPQGLDTRLGDDGGGLSGGQRQRIALARAFLKDAPLLILDEATSALDYESEQHIQAALRDLAAGRTTIVIAHRLSTVESADSIVVLDGGRVVETGTHASLLANDGVYAQLHRLAFNG